MQRQLWIYAIVALLLAACGTSIPIVTPTVAPTFTPDLTRIAENASDTPTPIIRLTDTPTPVPPTNTPVPTETNTVTPTGTRTPTATATNTVTPSVTPTMTNTATATASATPTATDEPTVTPLPLDTATPTVVPSFTPSLTPVPDTVTPTSTPTDTDTPTATFTNTPNIAATENAAILQTRAAVTNTPVLPTFTPVAIASPTNTLPPPTLDVTPTFITATPNTGIIPTPVVEFTPVESTPQIDFTAPTVTATPFTQITPTPFPLDQIPATIQVQDRASAPVLVPSFPNTTTAALNFDVGSGQFIFNGIAIGRGVSLFVVNPADPTSYASTDSRGVLSFVPIGGGERTITSSPFVPGFSPSSADTNQDFISALSWSPNGQRLAFVITPASGTDNTDAGVWFWDAASNQAFVLLHDCPLDGYISCNLTSRPVNNWQSISVEWSPNSQMVVITAALTTEGRQGIFVANMNFASSRPEAPPLVRWDNAQWLNNAELLVSGRAPDGRSQIAIFNINSGTVSNILFDATANGLFIYDAVQRPNGQIIAVGREGGAFDGAYRLYRIANGAATPISNYVGNGVPQDVTWATNYAEAVLTVNGVQYIVNSSNGAINVATTTGSVQVGPGFTLDASGQTQAQGLPPTGVVAGSRYSAGQQIQYIGFQPRNMRTQPAVSAAFSDVIIPGEFVTVLAGPYEADGYIWWEVSNARNIRAWVSVRTADGTAFFNP